MSTEDTGIGARARRIRRRRGLSQDAVAGLTGISKGYLSKLETGAAQFARRGLVEDLADALGCAPADLTGTSEVTRDRRTLAAAAALPALAAVLHDTTLDDYPDVPTRPIEALEAAATAALGTVDDARFAFHASGLGDLIAELHVVAGRRDNDSRRALEALVRTCKAACTLAGLVGRDELSLLANRRGWDAAARLERPDLVGFAAMARGLGLNRVGARRRAVALVTAVLADLDATPTGNDTAVAEATGMVHLSASHLASRDGRTGDAAGHLGEAARLAAFTGERNHMNYHFGPANVAAWRLAGAVERGDGLAVAHQLATDPIDPQALGSIDRQAHVQFDLARAWAQGDGASDAMAVHHLDRADRLAPLLVRNDPLARELVLALDRRARKRNWALQSIKNRLGVA